LNGELETARGRLLSIHGIGPETADAILLYAGNRASFVVDAYTRRILRRHYLCGDRAAYETLRELFHAALPADPSLFNQYHALFVSLGKKHCRSRARCEGCPLAEMPHNPML
jgi:endonuclease-3 related protein